MRLDWKRCRWLMWLPLLLLSGCVVTPMPQKTVSTVNIERYMGTWFEIAHLPNWFQKKCVADTTANYRLDGDKIRVHNRCRTADGEWSDATAVAYAVPGSGNAKLKVSFFRPFYGDYWIVALDPGYRWVLVGSPTREYAWILSRTPVMSTSTLNMIKEKAKKLGYNTHQFVYTFQHH